MKNICLELFSQSNKTRCFIELILVFEVLQEFVDIRDQILGGCKPARGFIQNLLDQKIWYFGII